MTKFIGSWLLLVLTVPMAWAAPASLPPPYLLMWAKTPPDVQALLGKRLTFVSSQPAAPDPDLFLYEQRYKGEALGMASDHIAPLFVAGRMIAIAASFSPDAKNPASKIFDKLVAKLTAQHGQPKVRTKPDELVSLNAILKLVPEDVRNHLTQMYSAVADDPELGRYVLMDLQIQVGSWVPLGTWLATDGSSVRVVMRAGAPGAYGLKPLKPAVIWARRDILE
jgi:hypothetical protein